MRNVKTHVICNNIRYCLQDDAAPPASEFTTVTFLGRARNFCATSEQQRDRPFQLSLWDPIQLGDRGGSNPRSGG